MEGALTSATEPGLQVVRQTLPDGMPMQESGQGLALAGVAGRGPPHPAGGREQGGQVSVKPKC